MITYLEKYEKLWLVDEKKDDGFSALHLACLNNYYDAVKCLIDRLLTLDINVKNRNNQTPLHLAVERNNYHVIKLLAETNRVNLNAQDKDGDTPMHCLIRNFMLFKFKYARELKLVSIILFKRLFTFITLYFLDGN